MSQELRKSQLINFENAAAGHDGVLSDKTGSIIVKPCKMSEINFYQAAESHPALKFFMPKFMGQLNFNQVATEAIAAGASINEAVPSVLKKPLPEIQESEPSASAWQPSGGAAIATESGLVMENIAKGFEKPNILDVKLGAQLWDVDSPLEKRARLDQVAAETTSKPLGFRIAGMKTFVGKDEEANYQETKGYKKYDKNFGRKFTADNVDAGFREFFFIGDAGVTDRLAKKIIKRFLFDLEGLVEAIEKEETRMYSASVLFVYEGDGGSIDKKLALERAMLDQGFGGNDAHGTRTLGGDAANDDEEEESESEDEEVTLPKIHALKLIDFAHARFVPGEGPDENLLHGVRNLVRIFKDLVN